jgi:hypothetical protein
MKKFIKQSVSTLFILILLNSLLFSLEIKSSIDAIKIAGEQRMLSQKVLKEYAMIGMNNTFGNPKKEIHNSIKKFENESKALIIFTTDKRIKKELHNSQKLWNIVKKTITKTATKDNAIKLQNHLEELLVVNNNIAELLIKKSNNKIGKIINLAQKQRMLSQRMASLYMLKVWGVDDKRFDTKMNDSMKLFKTSLEELEKYDKNNKDVKTLLAKVKKSFIFFEMMSKSKSKFIPSLIYKKSIEILKDMNKIVTHYKKLDIK